MKTWLPLIILLLLTLNLKAQEAKWSQWTSFDQANGVAIEYRTKPYGATQLWVQWRATNNNSHAVSVKIVKVYRVPNEVKKTDAILSLPSGQKFDPSPDVIPNVDWKVSADIEVKSTGR